MYKKQFKLGKEVIEHLEAHGYEAYFVGGCVRDLLLNRPTKDIDIATSALPDSVKSIFKKVIPLGIEHGTVIVRHESTSFEVTTYRIEDTYSDSRHPDHVEFIDNIESDLKRRDFTINALAMDKQGTIIDLFGGQADLNNQVIRAVGNDVIRFKEDSLRIMRAIRFTSQLGFKIDQNTLDAMKLLKHRLTDISTERITIEMEKLIMGSYIDLGFKYLSQTEVYKYLPVFKNYPDIIKRLPFPLQTFASFSEMIALCHFIYPDVSIKIWVQAWKCSNKTKDKAILLSEALTYYNKNNLDEWLVYKLTPTYYEVFLRLANVLFNTKPVDRERFFKLAQQLPIQSKQELAINGNDLIRMYPNDKRGAWIKTLLQRIENQVVLNRINNNTNDIKEWIKWNPPEIN